jgi:ElaB/YqjD/DUF883 family membrane-anchored ribosome-binding protein
MRNKMDPEQIQKILKDAIAAATRPPENNDNKTDNTALNKVVEAVQALTTKVEELDKTSEKKKVETTETSIEKINKALGELKTTIEEIKNPVADEDKPIDFKGMSMKKFVEMIKGALKPEGQQKPKGKGKETQKSILDNVSDDEEVDIDLSDVETTDIAGNELNDNQRLARKNLDKYFGRRFQNVAARFGAEDASDDAGDDAVDDGDSQE